MIDPRRNREDRVRDALEWISGFLDELGIPFQVAGGLAAIAHGSRRPLHDIDIYVPGGSLERLLPHLDDEHLSRGPLHHRDEHWDCVFVELHHAGVEIELADADRTRYRAGEEEPWHDAEVDFDGGVRREVYGVELPVMGRTELVRYKRRIGRDVDVEDVARIEASQA